MFVFFFVPNIFKKTLIKEMTRKFRNANEFYAFFFFWSVVSVSMKWALLNRTCLRNKFF